MTGDWSRGETAPGYSTNEVCALAGVTGRQLDHWCRTDLVWPTITDAHRGKAGWNRRWSREDVAVVRIISELIRVGFDVARIRDFAGDLRPAVENRVERPLLVIANGAAGSTTVDQVAALVATAPTVLILNLDAVCALADGTPDARTPSRSGGTSTSVGGSGVDVSDLHHAGVAS